MSDLCERFAAAFGRPPRLAVRAPGRVNLIGEHTDYNGGLALPCAIDRDTRVAASPRDDARVRIVSREMGKGERDLRSLGPTGPRAGDFTDYVAAVWSVLARLGEPLGGADLYVESDVPPDSGLSSSAALGVAVATAACGAHGRVLAPLAAAKIAHRGECEFVGVGCGIMDQFASALGRRDHALRIDCADESFRAVPLGPHVRLLIARSGVRRRLATGGYRERVDECAAVLAAAREAGIAPPGASRLGSLRASDLPALAGHLSDRLLRRARHVLTESPRVDAFAEAIASGDAERAGAVLREGQVSLRDDYEVSTPELDELCALGDAQPGCHGSRLTGAGFGGCTLHLVHPDAAPEVSDALATGFDARFGRRPEVLIARPSDGVGALHDV